MRTFEVAVRQKTAEREGAEDLFEFNLSDAPDRTMYAHAPDAAQIAVAIAGTQRHVPMTRKIAVIVDFFMAIMDDEDAAYLTERLLDRDDPFGIDELVLIMEGIIEDWSGKATEPSSGSTGSSTTSGTRSPQHIQPSTSSEPVPAIS